MIKIIKTTYENWKWYHKHSIEYVNPKGFKQWLEFCLRYPKAVFLCLYWDHVYTKRRNNSSENIFDNE